MSSRDLRLSPSPPTQSPDQMSVAPAPVSPESTFRPGLASPPDIKITAATPIDGRPETPPEEKIAFNRIDPDNLPELVTEYTRPGSMRGGGGDMDAAATTTVKPAEAARKHHSRRISEATLPEAVKRDDVTLPEVAREEPPLPPRPRRDSSRADDATDIESVLPSPPPQNEKLLSAEDVAADGYRPNALGMSVADAGRNTVTPLHLLGDQPDTIDCPFCQYRVETRVERVASRMTKIAGTICFFTTFVGTCVPCWAKWYYDIDQYCGNCNRKVTHRGYKDTENVVFGTPEHLRQISRFPPAPPAPPVEEKRKSQRK
ncbi:hypothetical protein F4779DRAFT_614471 [Xylariaceae sp. FL0662B]|nr:hypothetical protein F4779DRAFT_614471 [Xylariaceae sp. FL0662B]